MKNFTYNALSKSAFLNIKVKAGAKNNAINEFININDIYSNKMKSGYTKLNLEKSRETVRRGAERTKVREHSRTYKDDVANFSSSSSIPHLKISIKAIPEKGKANEEIISYLAKEWKLTRSNLEIIKGHTSSLKTILIKNIEDEYLNLIISAYINIDEE